MSGRSEPTYEWCVERGHPWVTYNPHLDRTWCRCGERVEDGEQPLDWDAKWSIFHDHPLFAPCDCYVRRDRESRAAAKKRAS